MAYLVKTGSGVALVSLDAMAPQPRSTGVQYTRRTVAASGVVYDEGLYIALKWSLLKNATQYNALLVQFGLVANRTQAVTIYVPNEFRTLTRYNGLAVRPSPGADVEYENYFWRNLEIVVKDLVVAT